MDFFERLSKKATETYKNVADKTNKLASESNIKAKMGEDKKKINVLYTEIGKKVYQKYATDGNLDIKDAIQDDLNKIDELTHGIEAAEKEILNLTGMKKCVKCNQNVPINSKFCPSCGAEQPEPVEPTPEEKPSTPAEPVTETAQEQSTTAEKQQATEVATEVENTVEQCVEENKENNTEN